MLVDPSDPETFEEDPDVTEIDVEAPEADTAEQRTDLAPAGDDQPSGIKPDTAPDADVAEHARVIERDEDEYR